MIKQIIEKDDMKVMLMKQPYAITMAKHRLSVYQMRIMMRILHALQYRMIHDKAPYEITKDDLGNTEIVIPTKLLLTQNDRNYQELRRALEGLTKKSVKIQVKDKKGLVSEIFTNIVMESVYGHRSELVKLQISKNLLPQFLGLASNYSKYLLEVAFNSSSPNVMKLYQFASHWRDKKQVFLGLNSLREWLKIEDKYKNPAEIKRWILKPAIHELKEKADVWFDIAERVTEGRRMIGWKFNIYTRKEPKKRGQQLASLETQEQLVQDLAAKLRVNGIEESPAQRERREYREKLIYQYKLSSKQADKLLNNVSDLTKLKNTLYNIQLRMANEEIKNIGGYVTKVLTEQFDVNL